MAGRRLTVDDAAIFRWYAWAFARELDDCAIRAYLDEDARPLFDHLGRDPRLTAPLERFRRALASWPEVANLRTELAADFAALFLGSGASGAPPYASLYQGAGRLFAAPHERMTARLAAAGLRAEQLPNEPADHLSVMLDYLAQGLADETARADEEATRRALAEFVADELLSWLPSFQLRAERVATKTDTYQAMIALLIETLRGFADEAGGQRRAAQSS